jgi:hypothetical protein
MESMGLEATCHVYPALRDALVARFGEPRVSCGVTVWPLSARAQERTPQVHVVCAGTDCMVWVADFNDEDRPIPAGSVYTPGDVPRVLRELEQSFCC